MEIIACIQGQADMQVKHSLIKILTLVSGTINVVLEVILR